jgi:signal transduction histidine kinase
VRWYQTTKAPLETSDAGRCVLAIATDITAQKAAEAKLAEANRTLERKVAERTAALAEALERTDLANRAKTQFLANMSHELRTPLNAIIGFAQLLREEVYGPIRDDQRVAVADIESSGTHLLSVLSDVLDAAKIDAGHIDLREGDIDVRALVDSCHRLMRTRAADAGVELRVAVSPAVPAIRADATKLKQMLLNLLSNAIKFTARGGVVTVSTRPTEEGGLALAVGDTGIGMAPEDIPIALEPFRQVESSFARNYDGTGLGLFITKKFAEAHGGALAIDSAPGRGTTVEITLPAWRAAAPAMQAAE